MNLNGQLRITDSTTVSTPALKRILAAAEQKKVLEQQVSILNERISGYELTIKTLNERDTATVGSYERQLTVMKDQRKTFEDEIKNNEKVIRKLKRKNLFTSIGGLTGVVILTTLLIIK